MKILLTTLNAKYVHTSLGLWYIYQYCRNDYPELIFEEFNINQDLGWILGEIYSRHAAIVAFSCNIWNIGSILILCQRLKEVAPGTTIVLGGPEVWSEPAAIMNQHLAVDFIVVGEGELTFKDWLYQVSQSSPDWAAVAGLVYRKGDQIMINPPRLPLQDLSVLPFPYPSNLSDFRQKLVYYETARGCPYHCEYCLSANETGVRFFPLERVKQDLLRLIKAGIAQVKLVDRSFNCNPHWAKQLWRFLIEHAKVTNFHFEIVGDQLDDESLAILQQAPSGLFQFEIGVQSFNPKTLAAISRKMDIACLQKRVTQLVTTTKVFVHLDLIAGLPYEDYSSFARTFDTALALRPHRLQLGFLKLLRGSSLRDKALAYGYKFTREAPYEVLANPWLSYAEMLKLKGIEDLLERYYNSGRFKQTLQYLFYRTTSPFAWFERFSSWWKEQGFDALAHKNKDLYGYLLQFLKASRQWTAAEIEIFINLLKFDLLSQERMVELPDWAGSNDTGLKSFGFEFWKDPANRQRFFPDSPDLQAREIQRRTLWAHFAIDPLQVAKVAGDELVWAGAVYLFIYGKEGVKSYQIVTEG